MAKNISEIGVEGLGVQNQVRKYKGAKKWERKVNEREFHTKKSPRRRYEDDYDDYYDEY